MTTVQRETSTPSRPTGRSQDAARRRTGGRRRLLGRRAAPYLLVGPTVLLIVVFLIYPLGSVFYYSLQDYNLTTPLQNGFVGFANFEQMFADPLFWSSLGFTARWVVVEIALQLVLGVILALCVNQAFKGRGFLRALTFSPWAVSGVMTTVLWLLIYNSGSGWGQYLAQLGLVPFGTSILSTPDGAFWGAIIAELWKGVPFFAVLILADLQSVPEELYEAAQVDGANRVQRFLHVTLPHIRNAIILTTLLRAIWTFNNVDLLYTLTGGGPANSTLSLPLYVANLATVAKEFGYGSALTVAAFFILLFFSIAYLLLTKFGKETK